MTRSYKKFLKRLDSSGLRPELEKRAKATRVSLQEIYEGPRTGPVIAARRAVYGWLRGTKSMGYREIARLFDRGSYSIWKLTREKA